MTELLALIPSLLLAFLLWDERRKRDEAEQAWRLERVGLLNRIQAPERAVFEGFEPNDIRHVPFDSDEAFWAAQDNG